MPKYTGPIDIDGGGMILIDDGVFPPAFAEDLGSSKFSGRWIGSAVCIRKTWHDIGPAGSDWGQIISPKLLFRLGGTGPWNSFGILITSAMLHTYIGGTGSYTIGLGTNNSPPTVNRNILNPGLLATGPNRRIGSDPLLDYDPNYERGRLVDNTHNPMLMIYWDGTTLTSGPTGGVSAVAFGVIVPDPKVAGS